MTKNTENRLPSIFVSYRIADTLPIADRLAAELQRAFGADEVFFDRRTFEPGDAWDSEIETAVMGAAVVLVLIGGKWLMEQNEYGRQRLDEPDDWVRREVEEALVGEARVVPVLVDDASPPRQEALAHIPSIAALSSCQAAQLRTTDWDTDITALVDLLKSTGLSVITQADAARPIIPGRIATRAQSPFVGRSGELEELKKKLPPIGTAGVVVVRGRPGAGKSELAREFARQTQASYSNGAFFVGMEQGQIPVDLANFGSRNLALDAEGLSVEDRCAYVLRNLGAPTLLIYDNVTDSDSVRRWLPADDEATHVMITTTLEDWSGWSEVVVNSLPDADALKIVRALGGENVAEKFGNALVAKAAGLPVQLCPATRSVAKAFRRHRNADITISAEAEASFSDVWSRLDSNGRLLLSAATFFNPDRIRADLLRTRLGEAAGWNAATVDAAFDACLDLSLLEAGEELHMHRLLRDFIRSANDESGTSLVLFRDIHFKGLVESAKSVNSDPGNVVLVTELMCYPLNSERWLLEGSTLPVSNSDMQEIGYALFLVGLFNEARPWYERAVEETEQGDVHGRIDHESLGGSLHQVGDCLSQTGDYDGARPWYERAVEEKEQGDVHGRIDHESLGRSLHQVGYCLSQTGDYDGARPWYERAVEETEQGDVHGRIDHDSLGRSLHQVGVCLSQTGDYDGARPWYERAVEEAEQGDVHGRIDHDSLGRSLHQVGVCLSQTGDYDGARPWYERAVEETEQGDVHGRIDHASLGRSLHQVGVCLSQTGDYDGARPWYERAVEEKEQGDVHGRIDHESLELSRQALD